MAFNNTDVISKVKIGDAVYYLQDADVRSLLDTYGDIVTYNVEATLSDGNKIPTGAAVTAAINTAVADLAGAMHFEGVSTTNPATGVVTINGEVLTPAKGDVVLFGVKEFVYDGMAWQELGDEAIYLTTASAQANYVQKTFTIAGIDMRDNITADEIKAKLGLKALAYKDRASATVTDYANGITGVDYTPEGSVSVTLSQTSTAMTSTGKFKPAGTVSGTTTATGTVTIARNDENGVQISGKVSAPTITVTPSTAEVQHIESVGTLPSYTAAKYTAPSVKEAKSAFASEGLVAAMDKTDREMLVFSAAAKADALTSTGFNKGSYTAASFNAGSLPKLGTAQTVVTGIASASATAPTFTGDKFGATFSGTSANITATFAGTEGSVSVSGNYDKADVKSAGFTGTEATITPTLTKGSKTITVQ